MKPLISLIVPVHNFEKYLEQTIDSINNQTLDKKIFETIVIDDFSSDNSYNLLKKLTKNKKINLIKTRNNLKSYGTKNLGVNLSSGKYIALLDGDDFLDNSSLEETLNFMEKNPQVKYSYSQHRRVNGDGEFICNREGYKFSREMLLHQNIVGAIECFEKRVFDLIGGFRKVYSEDYDFALRASEKLEDFEIAQNPNILYNYRIHGKNKSIAGLESSRKSTSNIIKESLKRKEGFDADVFWSHMTPDNYNYYKWRFK